MSASISLVWEASEALTVTLLKEYVAEPAISLLSLLKVPIIRLAEDTTGILFTELSSVTPCFPDIPI